MANNNGKQLLIGMLLGAAVLGSGPTLAADKYMGSQSTAPKDTGAKDGSMNDWGTTASGFYVGGAVGRAKFSNFNSTCDNISNAGGTVSDCDEKSFAWKAFGGYQFIRYFGVEVGYADFGKARAKVSSPGVGDVDYKTRAVFLDGVVTVPIIQHLSFIAKGGVVRWNTKLNIDTATGLGLPSQNESGYSATYGAGFEYMFTQTFGMRAEYEFYNSIGKESTTGETHIHVMSLSGLLRF
jgi:OmpA-OmpF porin, OOP family